MRFPNIRINRIIGTTMFYYLPKPEIIIIDQGAKEGFIHIYKKIKSVQTDKLTLILEDYLKDEELEVPNILYINEVGKDIKYQILENTLKNSENHNSKWLLESVIDSQEIPTEVWIETYKEILPDFIACDKGNINYKRYPMKKLIKIRDFKEYLYKLRDLFNETRGSLWNAYAKTKFFNKVQTFLFTNVAAFVAYIDGKKVSAETFREVWEDKIIELIKKLK